MPSTIVYQQPDQKSQNKQLSDSAKEASKDPLHSKTLQYIVEFLEQKYGWQELGILVNIKCFQINPSIKSSLTFLRKTQWARAKVESLYLYTLRSENREKNI
ncbi:MAG: VF530 family protein [bacterium]